MSAKLLDAAVATGTSPTWTLNRTPRNHTIQITITGAPTAVTVDLEGSLDGTTWVSLASHVMSAAELTAAKALFHVGNKPTRRVRINLKTLTAGSSPTVTVIYTQEGP